ncbi:MAG: M1 family metallopeptidase [Saprospirales bacterium]|nr:M1 family metallopeptidase [Saprospirales bacterium]
MMNVPFRLLLPLLAGIFLLSCNPSKKLSAPDEFRILDTMLVTAPALQDEPVVSVPDALPDYQAAASRTFDLLHTRLEISFNWEEETVNGNALLIFKPYFYPSDKLVLDAKGFYIKDIKLDATGQDLFYAYDDSLLQIMLDKTYQANDTLRIRINYTAHPSESGGSLAITSDKGLFFINPRGEEPTKPRQVWTQGETESNSRWFPTIDKPNERCTQELFLTVEDQFKTLSNGVLVSSKKNAGGTRTDYWKMDQPHAPYLFMIAVGDYAVVEDTWKNVPLQYYVEPEFEKDAKAIFPYTPEMLEFFSNVLNYPYPWPKFAQVVVRDYVSGAMENTTAVVFGEFMQLKARELVDVLDNEKIVAHEMFHQWFGDLVTCESWANLTLNEGFANYSEYLWLEHKHGKEEADHHLQAELEGYVYSSKGDAHPLIHYRYSDRESMFDQHSYNKGGLTLHMLRRFLGDKAFFAGLNYYLTQNAYTAVEAHDLRLAMEEVSGLDLNWFFDQWFFQEGHPILDIRYSYDESAEMVVVELEQTQVSEGMPPIFEFPATFQIFLPDGTVREEKSWVRERIREFRFPAAQKPLLVLFDPQRVLLCERSENKSNADYWHQHRLAPNVRDRMEALQKLVEIDHPKLQEAVTHSLDDSFWAIRLFALDNMELDAAPMPKLGRLAAQDPHAEVRAASCFLLGQSKDVRYQAELEKIIDTDYAILVVASALDALYALSPAGALKKAGELEPEAEGFLLDVIAEIYLNSQDISKLGFFQNQMETAEEYHSISYLMGFLQLAKLGDLTQLLHAGDQFFKTASRKESSAMKRYAAMRSLNEIHAELVKRSEESKESREKFLSADKAVLEQIESVKAGESDPELKGIYRNFPDPKAK